MATEPVIHYGVPEYRTSCGKWRLTYAGRPTRWPLHLTTVKKLVTCYACQGTRQYQIGWFAQ